jgi:hypothetical protein
MWQQGHWRSAGGPANRATGLTDSDNVTVHVTVTLFININHKKGMKIPGNSKEFREFRIFKKSFFEFFNFFSME